MFKYQCILIPVFSCCLFFTKLIFFFYYRRQIFVLIVVVVGGGGDGVVNILFHLALREYGGISSVLEVTSCNNIYDAYKPLINKAQVTLIRPKSLSAHLIDKH